MADTSVDDRKRRLLSSVMASLRQPDPNGDAAATLHGDAVERLSSEDRRKLALAVIGVLGTAGLVLAPKDAKADLSFGEVEDAVTNALNNALGPLIRVLTRAFEANLGFGVPPAVMRVINLIIEWLAFSSETVITEDPVPPLERTWPREPPVSDAEKIQLTRDQSEFTRQRVTQSAGILGGVTTQQIPMAVDEGLVLAEATADPSILTKINATNALLTSLCLRVGQMCSVQSAHAQLTLHQTAGTASGHEMGRTILDRFLQTGSREDKIETLRMLADILDGKSVG